MLVSMKEMLEDARRNHYALPAFDVSNGDMMKAVLEACEEERSPALLMALGMDLQGRDMDLLVSMARAASDCFDVPVCLHLDHATDLSMIKRAVGAGFSSVMYDGSVLDFDSNARKTAEVVKYAHARGITVEAELGHVGNGNLGNAVSEPAPDADPGETLTVPEEVARFVEITDVDALAVAVGTAHGVYRKTPTLRIDRLDEITAVCDRPLVLHGGSGTPNDQIQEAVRHGITKINIYSDMVAALNKGLKETLDTMDNPVAWPCLVFAGARSMMKEVAREKLRIFGSAGKL